MSEQTIYKLTQAISIDDVLIFTDMDGTLLDHHTYSFDAVKKCLTALKKSNIAVIPNTSKTYAELKNLRKNIGLDSAFIVENGAAVYLPSSAFKHISSVDAKSFGLTQKQNYWVKEFARPRSHFLNLLQTIAPKYRDDYLAFSEMTVQQIAEHTGLNVEDAQKASQRDYGEPIKWLGPLDKKTEFIAHLRYIGGNVVEGGRFIHFADNTDKADAMQWLTKFLGSFSDKVSSTFALGDGNNDIGMLEAADVAIIIKSPVADPLIVNKKENKFYTTKEGPVGWAESIEALILKPRGLI